MNDAVVTLVELILQLNDRVRVAEHRVRDLESAAKEHICQPPPQPSE